MSSVHEVGRPAALVRLFAFPEGELDAGQSDHQDVETLEEKDEEEEPEAVVVALAVRLEDEGHLVEVGDPIGQMMQLHLGGEQDHHQAAAQTCRHKQVKGSIPCF